MQIEPMRTFKLLRDHHDCTVYESTLIVGLVGAWRWAGVGEHQSKFNPSPRQDIVTAEARYKMHYKTAWRYMTLSERQVPFRVILAYWQPRSG